MSNPFLAPSGGSNTSSSSSNITVNGIKANALNNIIVPLKTKQLLQA